MNLWDKILHHTERRVNPHSFATWFRPTRMERSEEDRLIVRVPTRLFCKRLTETYGQLLQAVARGNRKAADCSLNLFVPMRNPLPATAARHRPAEPNWILTPSRTS